MNFFTRKTTWSNAELYLYKLGVFSAGILFGVYGREFFMSYLNWFWLIAAIGCTSAAYFWFSKIIK